MDNESFMSELSDGDREYINIAWPQLHIVWAKMVGDYQGTNYIIGIADKKVLACGVGYGSCSGCGAWGEGGEPISPKDLIDSGVYGKTLEETLQWADEEPISHYQALTRQERERMKLEIKRAFALV